MSGKINLDFSSQIKQIDELKSAAQAFGQVMQDILSTSSRFGNIAQQAMTGVNQSNLGTPGQAQGSGIDQLGIIRAKMMENQQNINDFHRANPGAVNIGAGKYKVAGSTGTFIKNLGDAYTEQAELKRKARELEANQGRKSAGEEIGEQVREAAAKSTQSSTGFSTGTAMKFSALGYSIADLPSMLSRSQGVGGKDGELKRIEQTIKGLEGSGDKNSAIAAGVLKDVAKSLKDAQAEFTKALGVYNDPLVKENPEKQAQATERLIQAMSGLDDTIQQSREAERGSRALKGGGGGGGGERDDSVMGLPPSRAVALGRGLMAVAGAGVAAGQFAQQFSIGVGRAVVGGQIEKLMATGQFSEQKFRDVTASQDMSNVENMFRFRGDDLLGKKSQFLGNTGFQSAMSLAGEKQKMEVDLLRQERSAAKWGAIGQMGMGALQLGGAALSLGSVYGSAFAPALALGGIASIMGGGKDLISSFTSSPYSQLTGDLSKGVVGAGAKMAYGEGFDQLSSQKQQALIIKYNAEQYATARQLQDAEMQKQRPLMSGYQEIINTIDTQQEGAVLVGEYAVRGGTKAARSALEKQMPAAYKIANHQDRQREVKAKQEEKAKVDLEIATSKGTDRNTRMAFDVTDREIGEGGIGSRFDNRTSKQKAAEFKARQAEQEKGRQADLQEVIAEGRMRQNRLDLEKAGSAVPINPDTISGVSDPSNISTHAKLGLSLSDFNRHRDQVTNVLGGSAKSTSGQTERLVQLGRSGLGDFGSLMGNIAGINRATGGMDNTGKLETVLANAVASGFDKSRTSQQFAQTVIGLSEQANVSDVKTMAGALRGASGALGIGGIADEKSLRLAASGMSNYIEYTKQTTNTQGVLGMAELYRQGMGIGKGGALSSEMSNPEIVDAIEQLKSGKITSRKVQALLDNSGKTRQELASSLGATHYSKSASTRGMMYGVAGLDVNKEIGVISEMAKDKTKGGQKALSDYMRVLDSKAMEAGVGMGVGAESGVVALREMIGSALPSDINVKKLLDRKIEKSPFTDIAKQQKQAFLDSLTAGALVNDKFGRTGNVSKEEKDLYFKSLEMGGLTSAIQEGKFKGTAITQETYDKGTEEFKNAADKELKNLSKMDIIRNTNYAAAMQGSNIQQVYVTNLNDLGSFSQLADEIKRNFNKGP